MSTIVAYVRVSTAKQGASGLGIEAQREAIKSYAQTRHLEVVKEFLEIESGKHCNRPVLAKALSHARRIKATLIVARLDRLSRSVSFIASVLDANVDFACANNPGANRLLLHVLSAVAEEEARAVSERTKAALKAAKARGIKLGASNPACRNLSVEAMRSARVLGAAANRAKAITEYADLVTLIQGLHAKGDSLRKIAEYLNREGIPTRGGSKWAAAQVQRVLKRLA